MPLICTCGPCVALHPHARCFDTAVRHDMGRIALWHFLEGNHRAPITRRVGLLHVGEQEAGNIAALGACLAHRIPKSGELVHSPALEQKRSRHDHSLVEQAPLLLCGAPAFHLAPRVRIDLRGLFTVPLSWIAFDAIVKYLPRSRRAV